MKQIIEYLRFGESYTSLILGIIVVIISTALLLSFVSARENQPLPEEVPCEAYKDQTVSEVPVRCFKHFQIQYHGR